MSPEYDVGGFGGEKNFFVPVGIRTPDRPTRRVAKLPHVGDVQHISLSECKEILRQSRATVTSFLLRRKLTLECEGVYSRSYPARTAHALYCIIVYGLSGSTIFFHFINGTIPREKMLRYVKCVL